MNSIIEDFVKTEKFKNLINVIENKKSPIQISGLTGVGLTQIIAGINKFSRKSILIVTYNEIQAKKLLQNLSNFEKEKVVFFPKKEIVTYDYVAESKDLPYERIDVLNKIIEGKNQIIITTIEALMQKLPEKNTLYQNKLKIKQGDIINLEDLKKVLINLGYVKTELIEGKGQFSVRGGIVDISIDEKIGTRLEFWGDQIDSIRSFNINSQRSISNIEDVKIFPAHEYVLEAPIEKICERFDELVFNENEQKIFEQDLEKIREGNYISKIDKYFDIFYKKQAILLNYLKEDSIIFFDEIGKIEQREKNILEDIVKLSQNLIEKEKIVPQAIQGVCAVDIQKIKNQVIYLEKQDILGSHNVFENALEKAIKDKFYFKYREVNFYKEELESLISDIKKWNKDKKIYIMFESKEKIKKMGELLEKENILYKVEEKASEDIVLKSAENIVTLCIGKITEGFENYESNQIVLTLDDLISGGKKRKSVNNKIFRDGEKIVFADLKVGDYVVHKNYGIGIFIGVNTLTADNTTKDYLKLKYKGDDILYIPTNQMDSIRKYVGGEVTHPQISALGNKDWIKTKEKVKNNLRAVAKELIELYAKREKADGYAYSPDTPWQKQFEDKFPYQETDDQLRCIEEIKHDMEKNKPMDRLLCGDVGYGKTEVAIRAAFKATMDNKQVAYLVPTTVLAQQQYEEFKERMQEFPIKVDILNRFKTKKYQDEVIKKLKLGEIDIVIGTHRMLSKDVEFKNIGLLIIDEEHRFGVKAKEKIKQYKENIDVLTMTATPIPRTMHMSIVGIRDMSVIYEPPRNRKPVQTYVLEYDSEVIKEAITRELERDGQVFYIFNNVQDIEKKAAEIERLVPESVVAYAHGQMTGSKIEEIMQDFVDKKTNVLVCTTILESGIDIPNANTIIVENADRMGLAALYQIRGRVGRSDRQAYAYITYRKEKMLTEEADKRLKAIKEFTEFGSGFKIAMRDLEIRGAGSLLGEIQSGHLEQVGYDTYCNLLDEVVKEMQGIEIKKDIDVQIDLNVTTYIPDSYISDSSQKIEIYQNIALCKNEEDIQNVLDEIIDRYGDVPDEIEKLLDVARIKYMCKNLEICKVSNRKTSVVLTFENAKKEFDISKLVKNYGNSIKFSSGIKPSITVDLATNNEKQILNSVKKLLKTLSEFNN